MTVFAASGPTLAQVGVDGLRLVGRNLDQYAHVMSFQVVGDYAYASVGFGRPGLETYDISDPADPVRVSTQGGASWRASVSEHALFSYRHLDGVEAYDISSGIPVLLDAYDPLQARTSYEGGVRVGDSLYVASHQIGIEILHIREGGFPDSSVSAGRPWGVDSRTGDARAGNGRVNDGRVDGAPADGARAGEAQVAGRTRVGPRMSLSYGGRIGLTSNAAWDIEASGGYLFVANGRFGLEVVRLSGTPAPVATLPLPGLANDIVISGATAILALGPDGVATVDIADPNHPLLLDIHSTLGNAFSMGLVGDRLAVGAYPYLEEYDVSDPRSILRTGWDQARVYAMGAGAGVNSAGDTVYVVADWEGMAVYLPEDDPGSDIEIVPTHLDFGAVTTPRDTTVEVRNTGSGTLHVDFITTPIGFSASPTDFMVPPGGVQHVTVTATGAPSVQGKIHYFSNDPDEFARDQIFSTQFVYQNNTTFPQAGSPAPFFQLRGTDGNFHWLTRYLGKVVYLEFGANW